MRKTYKTNARGQIQAELVGSLANVPEYGWFDGSEEPTPLEPSKLAWGIKFNTTTGTVITYGWTGTTWVEVV